LITVAGFNTTIDRFISVDALHVGEVNRAVGERLTPGGKGLHVAQTIAALGERVQLVGLVDAAHRNLIGRRLSERGVLFHAVEIPDSMRQCLALQDAAGQITEVLGQGPELDEKYRTALVRAFRRGVDESDWVILSGSLPRGFPVTTYADLAMHAHDAGRRCLIDASGDLLKHAVAVQPYLVKPNRDEISVLLGHAVIDLPAAIDAVEALHASGVATPMVTMGALGVVGIDDGGIWHASVEVKDVRNTVGSGDCLLAGVTVGMARGLPLQECMQLGVACGAANAMGDETGFVERKTVDALLPAVRVVRVTEAG
jgi:1-phosphofructokinase family hexose kinase